MPQKPNIDSYQNSTPLQQLPRYETPPGDLRQKNALVVGQKEILTHKFNSQEYANDDYANLDKGKPEEHSLYNEHHGSDQQDTVLFTSKKPSDVNLDPERIGSNEFNK